MAAPQRCRRRRGHGDDDARVRRRTPAATQPPGPLDYDDSLVPGKIVAGVMHLPHVTDREDHELGLILRWSYGSVFGLWHGVAAPARSGAVGERARSAAR